MPIDNGRVENLIRSWALGRSSWLFAGPLRSGQRVGIIINVNQCTKLNGHEPYAYLENVPERLPTQKTSQIHELLPIIGSRLPDHSQAVMPERLRFFDPYRLLAAPPTQYWTPS